MVFKVCNHLNQRFFKFNEISSSQSKKIFHSCCKINFSSSIDEVKSPNRSKTEDIKLSKPHFYDENDFMTAFTLIVSLSGFHNIPKALSNGILSKSRLTDWQLADKSSWGKDFKISLSFTTNLVKMESPFFQNFAYFFAYIYSFCLTWKRIWKIVYVKIF